MKTQSTSKEEAAANRQWYVVDARGATLGRLASQIAHVLRGKHKVAYTPHVDTGDFVIVVNAGEVRLTGRKEEQKTYYHHTGWVGGIVGQKAHTVREKKPERLLEHAVKGMLPKGPLGRQMRSKLKLYASDTHPHAAQKPQNLVIKK